MSDIPQSVLDILQPIHQALDDEGITHEYLAKKLKAELEATEIRTFKGDGKGKDVVYSEPMIAWPVRQKARMDAHRLRGDYPAEELKLDSNVSIEVVNYGDNADKDPA